MSTQENKALVLRLVEEFHRGNLAFVGEVFFRPTSDSLRHRLIGTFPMVLKALARYSPLCTKAALRWIEDIVAEEDTVAVRWTLTGVYHGETGAAKAGRENDYWICIPLPICERQDRSRLRPEYCVADWRPVEVKVGQSASI